MLDLDKRVINGKMLKRVRADAEDQYGAVTIKEASLRSRLSVGYISNLESGKKFNVSIEALQKLAKAYGCHLHMEFIRIPQIGIRTRYDLLWEKRNWELLKEQEQRNANRIKGGE